MLPISSVARTSPMRLAALIALAAMTATTSPAARELDVPYFPTPQVAVDKMLEMAEIKEGDVLIDLGSGDGRIPITAAKRYGIRAHGVDLDPARVMDATEGAKRERVADKVTFKQQDLFETDLSEATVITMFLLTSINVKLRPDLLKLEPGTRILSYAFGMGDWAPDKSEIVDGRRIYMWVVPKGAPRLAPQMSDN